MGAKLDSGTGLSLVKSVLDPPSCYVSKSVALLWFAFVTVLRILFSFHESLKYSFSFLFVLEQARGGKLWPTGLIWPTTCFCKQSIVGT